MQTKMDAFARLLKLFIRPKKDVVLKNPKKILVFKSGAIGDILWTTPFLRLLRKKYPKSEIVYCVGSWSSGVLINNPNIDRIIEINDVSLFKKDIFYIISTIRQLRKEQFDCVFAFDKHYLSNLFVYFTKIPIRVGFDRLGDGFPLNIAIPYENKKHEIEYNLDLIFAAEKKAFPKKSSEYNSFLKNYFEIDIFPSVVEIKNIDNLFKKNKISKKIIGIAPGGGKNFGQDATFRRWPLKNYVDLANKLLEKKYAVVLFGGPNEIELGWKFDKRCFNLIGMLSIRETSYAMGKCDWIVCNDSGQMHLASASNAKVLSLFGPTNPKIKAPLKPGSKYLWKDKDIYYPEYDLYGGIKETRGFMERITFNDVLAVIEKTSIEKK